jgi:hypothetical protein
VQLSHITIWFPSTAQPSNNSEYNPTLDVMLYTLFSPQQSDDRAEHHCLKDTTSSLISFRLTERDVAVLGNKR